MLHILLDLGKRLPANIPYQPIKNKAHLLVFDVSKSSIFTEEMDNLKAKTYVWVGNRKGNEPKDRLIVSKDALRYLFFTTPFYLLDNLKSYQEPRVQAFINRLQKIVDTLGVLELKSDKGKSFLMLKLYNLLSSQDRDAFLDSLKKETGKECRAEDCDDVLLEVVTFYSKEAEFQKTVTRIFSKVVSQGISSKDDILFTFADEQGIITQDTGYCFYVEQSFKPRLQDAKNGFCRGCNKQDKVTPETSAFKFFKFWNTDKPGFAPSLNKNMFSSSFGLCANCYAKILAGDRFAWENLNSSLAGLRVILLPSPVPDKTDLKQLALLLKKRLNAVNTVEMWKEFEELLQSQAKFWEDVREQIAIDFIFFEQAQSAIKVFRTIHEVPPSRLDELDDIRKQSLKWARSNFTDIGQKKSMWDLDLKTQFSLIPTYKDTKVPSLFLSYLESLLHGEPFSREAIIKGFLEIARAHHLGYVRGFRSVPTRSVHVFIIQSVILQYYAQQLGVLPRGQTGGNKMILAKLPEHLSSYLENQVPKGKQQGLFLLGYVIGLIGRAQQKGVSLTETKSPAILNAISFTGMDEAKIRRLVNFVADRMRHYLKGWDYKEGEQVLAASMHLLESEKQNLPLYENTYWVLAGYGFARLGLRKQENEEQGEQGGE